ncbi:glycosyltransferase family A protein [Novosphingobium sp. SG720]|uniref:glycosyltransferase family 2 protein n=1 Tax=Novosphingobium sp. SG720 TaxID=2586998 RepID=UPI0014459293|nr:glycosyltransferase family A protein [Novosphingobium sp. SG720]NKJ43465.1 hypothetical protein [Novosphingobium sp. SG720]
MAAPPYPCPTLPDGTPARVSVIVPGFGVAAFLGDALTSLQRQTLEPWEAVVVDDGDPAVAKAVAPFLADPRIRLLQTPNRGVSAARNAAIAASQAPLIALLDGDDLFRPGYLAATVPLLEQQADLRLVTCNARMFGAVAAERHCVERPQPARGTWIDVLDRSFNVYIGSTFRRADCLAVGGFDETMTHAEDLDLWVRLMGLGGQAHYLDEVLCEYRVRAGSASAQAMRLLRGSLKVQTKARATLPPAAPEIPRIEQLMNETRDALAFEEAIDRIVAGQARSGLADLRRIGSQMDGPVWQIAMALWHWLPGLAAPMLRWRRRAHRRGGTSGTPAPSFLETEQ